MHRFATIVAAGVLTLAPVVAGAGSAHAAPSQNADRTASSTQTVAAQRAAVLRTADLYAAQAPRLSTAQKSRNADHLAAVLRVQGITTQQRAIAIGKTQLGTMYRWGGTTPAGFDCSGLTRFAYAKAGKTLPRTAAQQQRATKRVSRPAPGDLVFYGAPAYHVGIYVGDGKMLHAPRTGKPVQVANVWKGARYGRV